MSGTRFRPNTGQKHVRCLITTKNVNISQWFFSTPFRLLLVFLFVVVVSTTHRVLRIFVNEGPVNVFYKRLRMYVYSSDCPDLTPEPQRGSSVHPDVPGTVPL